MTSLTQDREGSTPRESNAMDYNSEGELRRRKPQESMFRSTSDGSDSSHVKKNEQGHSIFVDCEEMKRKVRENLTKPAYDVANYYHKNGLWRNIATNPAFEKVTLAVIGFNAIWIGVDTDWNKSQTLIEAEVPFQIAEHFFCSFFSFEWFSRFMSFRRKSDGLRDAWFVFDSCLVIMMVLETWILTIVMLMSGGGGSGGMGNASVLRMARLARLSRMARMARLLRAMPELMILIKGIVAATRSVFFTLALLCLLMYIFAIMFTQLTKDTEIGQDYFNRVGDSMYTLLVYGTLMDNITLPLSRLGEVNFLYGGLFLLFVLLAALTLMNMLIGVLTEVVSAVAATEKETLTVLFVKNKMQEVLAKIDQDGDGTISKVEFEQILASKAATEALSEVDVDVIGLVDFADFIFADEEENGEPRTLNLSEFMQVVLQFRGSNSATVKDVVNLRKFVSNSLKAQRDELRELKEMVFARAALSIEDLADLERVGREVAEGKRRSVSASRRSSTRTSCQLQSGAPEGVYKEVPLDILTLNFPIAEKPTSDTDLPLSLPLAERSEEEQAKEEQEETEEKEGRPPTRSRSREEIYHEKLAAITAVIEANGGLRAGPSREGCGDWGMGSARNCAGGGRTGPGGVIGGQEGASGCSKESGCGVGCLSSSSGGTGGTGEGSTPMLVRGQTGHLDACQPKRRIREEDLPPLPTAPTTRLTGREASPSRPGRQRLPPLPPATVPQVVPHKAAPPAVSPEPDRGTVSGSASASVNNDMGPKGSADGHISFGTGPGPGPDLVDPLALTLHPLKDGLEDILAAPALAAETHAFVLPPLAPLNPPVPHFVPSATFSSWETPLPPSTSASPMEHPAPPTSLPVPLWLQAASKEPSLACSPAPQREQGQGRSTLEASFEPPQPRWIQSRFATPPEQQHCVNVNVNIQAVLPPSTARDGKLGSSPTMPPATLLFKGSILAPGPLATSRAPVTTFPVPPPSVADMPGPPPTGTASFGRQEPPQQEHPRHQHHQLQQQQQQQLPHQHQHLSRPPVPAPSAPLRASSTDRSTAPPPDYVHQEVLQHPTSSFSFPHPTGLGDILQNSGLPTRTPAPHGLTRQQPCPLPSTDSASADPLSSPGNPGFALPSALPMPRWGHAHRHADVEAEAPPPLPAPAFSMDRLAR